MIKLYGIFFLGLVTVFAAGIKKYVRFVEFALC